MAGLTRMAQDGTITIGDRKTRFRIEKGTPLLGPWLVIETDKSGGTTTRAYQSELKALSYVVGQFED